MMKIYDSQAVTLICIGVFVIVCVYVCVCEYKWTYECKYMCWRVLACVCIFMNVYAKFFYCADNGDGSILNLKNCSSGSTLSLLSLFLLLLLLLLLFLLLLLLLLLLLSLLLSNKIPKHHIITHIV